jgi:DNA (cytosine-5)-methyltransferase 1
VVVTLHVLDLFSGIGGFSLGLERAGMRAVGFCEIEPYCRKVLARHWPGIPIYEDVRTLTGARLAADGIVPDVICGGFPCQDISIAGKGAGIIEGTKSGLWFEYARIIGEVRPNFVVVENVANILRRDRGFDQVLGDLAALGYDAEWHCIPASAAGAPHARDRVWIVAHPSGSRLEGSQPICGRLERSIATLALDGNSFADARHALESGLGDIRAGDGVSARMDKDRLGALGNAVVPQIPELIGRAILAHDATFND